MILGKGYGLRATGYERIGQPAAGSLQPASRYQAGGAPTGYCSRSITEPVTQPPASDT